MITFFFQYKVKSSFFPIHNRKRNMVAVRPILIRFRDSVRPLLEPISPELGMTDPISGEIIFEE